MAESLGQIFMEVFASDKDFHESLDKIEDRAKATADDFKKVGGALTAAGLVMAGAFGGAIKVASDFESNMSKVKALSGATKEEFTALSKTARDLGKSTVFSASQAAEGMQFLSMAGFKANEQIQAMPGLLATAAAGSIELGQAADITSNILSGFGIEASQTSRVADVLTKTFTSSNTTLLMLGDSMKFVAPVAKAAGAGLEEMAAATGILGNAGIQGGMAGRVLRSTILRLLDPPKEVAAALDALSVSVTDNSGKMRPLADIIEQVKNATKGMSEAQKTAYASQIAGTESASGFIALMDAGAVKIRAYTNELKSSGGIAEQIAKEQNSNLAGSFKTLKSALEEAAISIGSALIPTIKFLTDSLKNTVNWFNSLDDSTKETIAIIGGLTAAFALTSGPILALIGFIPSIIAGFASLVAVGGTVATVLTGIGPIIMAIVAAGALLIANWDKIKETAINVWEKGIAQSIADLLRKFPEWISAVYQQALEIGENLIKGIWEGVKNTANWLQNNFGEWSQNLLNEIKRQFKIQSPSKETEQIGKYISEGLAIGINKGQPLISNELYQVRSLFRSVYTSIANDSLSFSGKIDKILKKIGSQMAKMALNKGLQALSSNTGVLGTVGKLGSAMFGGFRANGGDVQAGKSYVVGEDGPEVLKVGSSGSIIPNKAITGGGGSNHVKATNVVINIQATDLASFESKLNQVKKTVSNIIRESIYNDSGMRSAIKNI